MNRNRFVTETPEMTAALKAWCIKHGVSFSVNETAVITSAMQEHADNQVKKKIAGHLDINADCKEDLAFSTDLEIGNTCQDCEFLITDFGSVDGSTDLHEIQKCSLGYWKDEI